MSHSQMYAFLAGVLTDLNQRGRILLGRFTAVADDRLHDAIDELVKSKPGPLNADQVTVVLIQRRMEEDQADCLDMF